MKYIISVAICKENSEKERNFPNDCLRSGKIRNIIKKECVPFFLKMHQNETVYAVILSINS